MSRARVETLALVVAVAAAAATLSVGCATTRSARVGRTGQDALAASDGAAPGAVYSVNHYEPPAGTDWYPTTSTAPPRLSTPRTLGTLDDAAYTDAREMPPRVPSYATPLVLPSPGAAPRGYGLGYGFGAPAYGFVAARGYGAYSGAHAAPFPAAPRASGGGTPTTGGNWPAVPSYGPRFPYPTGGSGPDVTRR